MSHELYCFDFRFSDDTIEIRHTYTVDEFIGYLTTWSAYQRYRQENPDMKDPMEDVRSG
jgi:hypothetical protein